MFVVIVCTNCQGASQVEEAALGQVVQCPLCGKPTAARTKDAVLPVANPLQNEPLSLDDALPLPSRPELNDAPPPAQPPKKKRSPLKTACYSSLSLFLTLVLMAGIFGAFRYGNGEILSWAWKTYTPPDGHCTIDLPGEPEVEDISPEGFAVLGGKRFHVHRWFERVDVDFGWIDLNADQALDAHIDRIVFDLLRRETKRFNGRMTSEKTLQFIAKGRKFEARRFLIDADQGKAQMQLYFDPDSRRLAHHTKVEMETRKINVPVPSPWGIAGSATIDYAIQFERRVFEPGQHIRINFALVRGKKIHDKMAWIDTYFNSFVPE
jgi:hypothetical protein